MSIKSAFKDDSEYDTHGSSDSSEHLTDFNIFQSNFTYGRNKLHKSISISSDTFPDFVEELYADDDSETVASVRNSSYCKNNTKKNVKPKFCLFGDDYDASDYDPYDASGSSDSSGSFLSKNSETNLTRIDVKSSDDPLNVLPQKSSKTSTGQGNAISDVINAVNLDVKKGDAKTPSISVRKQNIWCFDEVERSVDMIGCVRNMDTPKKSRSTKTPSDTMQNKTTTTAKFLQNPVNPEQKRISSSLTLTGDSLEQYVNDYFQRTENMCILQKQEIADEIFLRHPSLRGTIVSEFCNHPQVIETLNDYLTYCVNISPDFHDEIKGYDFPENFESENLLSVTKDIAFTFIYYIIPKDSPKPSKISYLKIMEATELMSLTEKAIMMRVFKVSSFKMLTLDDVLSRLDFVAFLVIFYEYKIRHFISN